MYGDGIQRFFVNSIHFCDEIDVVYGIVLYYCHIRLSIISSNDQQSKNKIQGSRNNDPATIHVDNTV